MSLLWCVSTGVISETLNIMVSHLGTSATLVAVSYKELSQEKEWDLISNLSTCVSQLSIMVTKCPRQTTS